MTTLRHQRKGSHASLKRKADKLFSAWIRSEGRCEWCGKRAEPRNLEAAHIFSRRFLTTRWDYNNCLALCHACHRKAHDKPIEFVEFVKSDYLTPTEYEALRLKAKTSVAKPNLEEVISKYQLLMEEI